MLIPHAVVAELARLLLVATEDGRVRWTMSGEREYSAHYEGARVTVSVDRSVTTMSFSIPGEPVETVSFSRSECEESEAADAYALYCRARDSV